MTDSLADALLLYERTGSLYALREINGWTSGFYMPKLSATVTQTVTTEVEIEPQLKAHLAAMVDTAIELQSQAKMLKEAIDVEKKKIFDTLELIGTDDLVIDDVKMKITRGTSTKLDLKKLYVQGITQAQIDMATVRKPKKAFVTVKHVNEPEESYDEPE